MDLLWIQFFLKKLYFVNPEDEPLLLYTLMNGSVCRTADFNHIWDKIDVSTKKNVHLFIVPKYTTSVENVQSLQ